MRSARLSVLLGVVGIASIAMTQAKPNFAGTWASPLGYSDIVIIQTDTVLTLKTDNARPFQVRLDGVENAPLSADLPFRAKTHWDGQTLVIERWDTVNPYGPLVTREVWSINADGQLTIERGVQDGRPAKGRSVYQRREMPNFAGTWTLADGAANLVNPRELVITQTATLLTVAFGGVPANQFQVRLDGVDTTPEAGRPVRSRTQLDGHGLVITNSFVLMEQALANVFNRQVWSINADGQLTIETIEQNGRPVTNRKGTYKRR